MFEKWTSNSLGNIPLALGNSYYHIFTLESIKTSSNFINSIHQQIRISQNYGQEHKILTSFIRNLKIFNATKSHAKRRSMKVGQSNVQIVARMEALHNTPNIVEFMFEL